MLIIIIIIIILNCNLGMEKKGKNQKD